jgi:hypothetical protein
VKVWGKSLKMQWSEVKWSEVPRKLWWGYEVERREGHGEMWVHQFMTLRIILMLLFSVEYAYFFIDIDWYKCSCNCIFCSCKCILTVFIVCSVSFIVCVILWSVFCLSVVCYFVWCFIYVLCLIVISLSPGKNTSAAKINSNSNSNNNNNNKTAKQMLWGRWRVFLCISIVVMLWRVYWTTEDKLTISDPLIPWWNTRNSLWQNNVVKLWHFQQ